jgi:hypothetical protein
MVKMMLMDSDPFQLFVILWENLQQEAQLREGKAEDPVVDHDGTLSNAPSSTGRHITSDTNVLQSSDSVYKRGSVTLMEPWVTGKRAKLLDEKDQLRSNMLGETMSDSCHLLFPHVLKCRLRETTRVPMSSPAEGSMFSMENISKVCFSGYA